jgi:hypothetical protein
VTTLILPSLQIAAPVLMSINGAESTRDLGFHSRANPLPFGVLSGRHLGAASCGGRVKASTCAHLTHAQAAKSSRLA